MYVYVCMYVRMYVCIVSSLDMYMYFNGNVHSAPVALVRHILKHTPLPYTVVLLVLGLLFGLAADSDSLKFLREYSTIASIDPHLILFIFLPILIFESAFIMDVHTFKKTILQSLVLAGPGLLVSTFLTALMARYIFYTYSWSWVTSLLFGAILSATDPVSVVALLKELGTVISLLCGIYMGTSK